MVNFTQWRDVASNSPLVSDIITVENVNSIEDDMPDVTGLSTPKVYEVRSGDYAPDLLVPADTDVDGSFEEYRSLINAETVNVIPDKEDLHAHYPFNEYSTSSTSNLSDKSSNSHDLVNGSISGYGSINGVQAADFDGSSDTLYTNSFSGIDPATVFAVVDLDSGGSDSHFYSFETGDFTRFGWTGSEWELYSGNRINGSTDTSSRLFTGIINGSNSVLREGGSQVDSGNISGTNLDIHSIGAEAQDHDRNFDGRIGEIAIYPYVSSTSQINDVESYLAKKWGISI